MKKKKKPARRRVCILAQLCKYIPSHVTSRIARELGDDGICVNSISPGFTFSDQIEAQREKVQFHAQLSLKNRSLKRDQFPEDLVGTLLFLCSPDSDFMTGQTVVVDGGFVVH